MGAFDRAQLTVVVLTRLHSIDPFRYLSSINCIDMAPKGGNAKKESGRAKKAENESKKAQAAEAEKVRPSQHCDNP